MLYVCMSVLVWAEFALRIRLFFFFPSVLHGFHPGALLCEEPDQSSSAAPRMRKKRREIDIKRKKEGMAQNDSCNFFFYFNYLLSQCQKNLSGGDTVYFGNTLEWAVAENPVLCKLYHQNTAMILDGSFLVKFEIATHTPFRLLPYLTSCRL